MANNLLEILIQAKNQAGPGITEATNQIKQLGTEAKTATDNATQGFNDLKNKTDEAANSSEKSVNSLKNITGAVNTLKSAVQALIGAWSVKEFLNIGEQLETNIIKMKYTWGENTDAMIAKAKELSDATNQYYSFNDIATAMNNTAEMALARGLSIEQYTAGLRAAIEVATRFGMDVSQAMRLVEMASDGMVRAGRQLKVNISDQYMQFTAYNGQLRDTWKNLDENSKYLLRYNEIMRQIGKDIGITKEMGTTLEGELRRLGNELKAQLGPDVAEVVKTLANNVRTLSPVIKEVGTALNGVLSFYNGLPDEIKGPLGVGIIGAILFGPKAGILIGLIDDFLNRFKKIQDEIKETGGVKMADGSFQPVGNSNTKGVNGQRLPLPPPPSTAEAGNVVEEELKKLATIVQAIRQVESRNTDYNPNGTPVTSSEGAKYAMQVLPSTAANPGFGITPAASDSPEEYNRVGQSLVIALWKKYQKDTEKVFAAYFQGTGTVDKAIAGFGDDWKNHLVNKKGQDVSAVTQDYIKNANASMNGSVLPGGLTGNPIAPDKIREYSVEAQKTLDDVNKKITDATHNINQAIAQESGDFYKADIEKINKWADDQTAATDKTITEIKDKWDKLEIWGRENKFSLESDPKAQEAYNKAVDEYSNALKGATKIFWDLIPLEKQHMLNQAAIKALRYPEEIAQVNVELQKLIGNQSQQLQAEKALLEIQKQQKVLEAGGANTAKGAALTQYYDELIRVKSVLASDDFSAGFGEGIKQIQRDLQTTAQLGKDVATGLVHDLSSGFGNFIVQGLEGKITSLKDAWTKMCDFLEQAFGNVLQKIIQKWMESKLADLFGGFLGIGGSSGASGFTASPTFTNPFNGNVYHSGGVVGITPAPTRMIDPFVFASAHRYHTGLASDEVPGIFQKGETILPKGTKIASGTNNAVTTNVNITVNSSGGAGGGSTNPKDAEDMGRQLSKIIETSFDKNLEKHMRPGGLLNKGLNT
jgi:soluble lytic murein transglycosylase